MQLENNFSLYKTANYTVVSFPFKVDKILSSQSPTLRKQCVPFIKDEFVFFSYFIFLLPGIFYQKQIEHTTRGKMRSSTMTEKQFIFLCAHSLFSKNNKILSGQFLTQRRNLVAYNFAFIERKI
jgi:RNA recognition motif-containing protein